MFILGGMSTLASNRDAPSARPFPVASSLEFVPNRGQFRSAAGSTDSMLYVVHGKGTSCYLSKNALHYVQTVEVGTNKIDLTTIAEDIEVRQHRIDVLFVGANPSPRISERDTTEGTLNYYLDGARVEGVRAVRRLTYHDLYPQIDLVVYANDSTMKYDFVVHPGGNPDDIVMRYSGMQSLSLLKDGRCRATTTLGTIDEQRPYTHQDYKTVTSGFVRHGNDVSFRIGRYDRSKDLVIDPYVLWATYYGGNSQDWVTCVRTDTAGNVIIAGLSGATNQIATPGAHRGTPQNSDAFVAKFNSNGVRLWGTYFGGNFPDGAAGLAIGNDGTIFIGGATQSDNIATVGAHQTVRGGANDLFLASFTADGVLRWSTYFGGERTEGISLSGMTQGITLMSNGNLAIAGHTNSTTGIATANAHKGVYSPIGGDGLLAVFNPDGVLQWATYVGGDDSDDLWSIATDHPNDRIIISGSTRSETRIATAGTHQEYLADDRDAYVMAFDNTGVQQWGTYYGGEGHDEFYAVGCGVDGSICATGQSSSATGIATTGAFRTNLIGTFNMIIVSFTSEGLLRWGTYYSEAGTNEYGVSVAFRGTQAYVSGFVTTSTNIATSDGIQTTSGGGQDALIVKFDTSGQRLWGTYYGGESHEAGFGLHADASHNVYLSGLTMSATGISRAGAHQVARFDSRDGYVVKICDLPKPTLTAAPDSTLCPGAIFVVTAQSESPVIRWYDGTTPLPSFNDSVRYTTPSNFSVGTHSIWVEVGNNGCTMRSDTLILTVSALPIVTAMNDTAVCKGSKVRLNATVSGNGPFAYRWTPTPGLDDPNIQSPLATVETLTKFTCTVTDVNGCVGFDTVTVSVHNQPTVTLVRNVLTCVDDSVQIGDTATSGTAPYAYAWTPSVGLSDTTLARPFAAPRVMVYHVIITDANGCTTTDSVSVGLHLKPLPMVVPNGRLVLCGADSIVLRADKGFVDYSWNGTSFSDSLVVRTAGTYVVSVIDANGCRGVSDTVTVVDASIAQPIITGPDAACLNSTVTYDVSGDDTHTYVWSIDGGGVLLPGASPRRTDVRWTTAGTWTVRVSIENADGCTASAELTVTVATSLRPVILPAGPIVLCNGEQIVLRASKGFVSYLWSNGAVADSIIVASSGTYSVTVVGVGGCTGKSDDVSVTIQTDPKPQPDIIASDTVLCAGDSAILTLSPSSFQSYVWSTGETSNTISVRTPGLYWANVVDDNGCTGTSDTIQIGVVSLPNANISASGSTSFCKGGNVELSVAAGPYTYRWSTGETTRQIVVTQSGVYVVSVVNAEGCETIASDTVVVYDVPDASISGPDAVCFATTSDYSVAAAASTVWSLSPATAGVIASGQNTSSIRIAWGGVAGIALVTAIVTTSDGCSDTATLSVVVDAELHPSIFASGPTTFCDGDSVILSVANGYSTYQWSDASGIIAGATSRFLTVRVSASLSCFVTNASGCSGNSDTMAVLVHPLPVKPVVSQVGIDLVSTPSIAYQWRVNSALIPGATLQNHTPLVAGSYTVTITDSNGCVATSDPYSYDVFPSAVIAVGTVPRTDPNRTIEIPIDLRSSTDLDVSGAQHYIGTLRYNGSMILPMSSRGGTISLPDAAVAGGTDRTVVFEGRRGTLTTGTLQWLQFRTLLGNDTCTALTLSDVRFTDAAVDITLEHGVFCESGICITDGQVRLIDTEARLELPPIHPNPAYGNVQIYYELNENGHTQLLLTDLLGRTISTLVDEHQQQGKHSAVLDVHNVATGWYRVVLRTPSSQRNQLLIVGGAR